MIENYKLEIINLQKRDTKDALAKGYKDKNSWFEYIIKQKKDKVAEEIIKIAQKYQLNKELVASHFDQLMVKRINNISK
jgi:type III secretion system FlhB-like substrate exporter